MTLSTERLLLRPWEDSDAENCYLYAKDPDVGPRAGWPAHTSLEESREILKRVLEVPETYAICLKTDGKAIGSVSLHMHGVSDLTESEDECELGYWLGKPFWGRGIMPEAAGELLRHAFLDLNMKKVWCAYYDGNAQSKRVQEKLGFQYQWPTMDVDVPAMHTKRVGHVNAMTREEWERHTGGKENG